MYKESIAKRCVFHYNGDMKANEEEERRWLDPDEPTNHELLSAHDGQECTIWMYCEDFAIATGEPTTSAYFDDGNELTVYLSELNELNERS